MPQGASQHHTPPVSNLNPGTPSQWYERDIELHAINDDPIQRHVLVYCDALHAKLVEQTNVKPRWWQTLFSSAKTPARGLYLWGGVGIGKTYLMDLFCDACEGIPIFRIHFHHFMQQIHLELNALQGQTDPLKQLALKWATQYRVLCFDEFDVTDITDAMLLAGLFDAFFSAGLCLVTTSNLAPDDLYRHGLQRQRFLPAIALIKQYCDVIHLQSQQDYRQRHFLQTESYFFPLNEKTDAAMQACFDEMVLHRISSAPLQVQGREIAIVKRGQDVVWFTFSALCSSPRSQHDYLEIAGRFSTVLVSGVPQIQENERDKITYLINLIDIFYDAHVNVVLSAAVAIDDIYPSGPKAATFERTKSRLVEMQSLTYRQQVR